MAHLSIRGARAAFVGPALDLSPHRNAVAVVAIALKDAFDLACLGGLAPSTLVKLGVSVDHG
jgi:hypothetical protein